MRQRGVGRLVRRLFAFVTSISKKVVDTSMAAKTRGARFPQRGRHASWEVRTALADAKAADLAPTIAELRAAGVSSLRGIARALNEREIPPPRGRGWQAVQVQRVLKRLPAT
jgi:recombinase